MKKSITIGVIVSILLFMFVLFIFPPGESSANFTIIPSDAQVKIDGEQVKQSKSYTIRTGSHKLEISRGGFISLNITTPKDITGKQLYTLTPSSEEGYTWLVNHPAEAQTREGAGGAAFDKASANLKSQNKLVTELPFVLSNLRIDYGNRPDGQLAIYITAATVRDRSEAIQIIRHMGYDPSDYIIIFKAPAGEPG